jgi:hypothetical protein
LTPKQRPLKVSAFAVATMAAPEMIRAAAVMAMLAPDFFGSFMFLSSGMSMALAADAAGIEL